jgi:CheY-like chemotaxis protein/HPt (histidine-containing phosphotransfer) domain-containing protein
MSISKVLVAEDNDVNREVLCKQLASIGCEVESVSDGETAADAASKKHFAVILMNLQMEKVGGIEATKLIRQSEKGRQTRSIIVGVTATSMPQERKKAFESGMDEILVRPFSLLDLQEVLSRWLPIKVSQSSQQTFDDLNAVKDPQLHQAFTKSMSGLMNRLFLSVHKQETSDVQSAVHEMKGLCLSVGYDELAGWCSQLEKSLLVSDWIQVQATFNAMVDQYKEITAESAK